MSVWLTSGSLIVAGAILLGVLCHRVAPRSSLAGILLSAYGIRVGFTVVLFCMSRWSLPILQPLHFEPGFWTFGRDCALYHRYAMEIVEAWKHGIELPRMSSLMDFFLLIAAVYRLLGCHPLFPTLLNSWFVGMSGVLAYVISRRWMDEKNAVIAAALVSFWPSTFIWPTQLLKDSLSWFLTFSALCCVLHVVPKENVQRPKSRRRLAEMLWGGLVYTSLAIIMVVLTRMRFYLGFALSIACVATLVPAACVAIVRRRLRLAIHYGGVAVIVVVFTMVARVIDVRAWVSPPHPDVGHFQLAMAYRQHGQLEAARVELDRAIALNPKYKEVDLEPVHAKAEDGLLYGARAVARVPVPPVTDERSVSPVAQAAAPAPSSETSKALSNTAHDTLPAANHRTAHDVFGWIGKAVAKLSTQTAYDISFRRLREIRQGFVIAGGRALMDSSVLSFQTSFDMLCYLPRGLLIGLLAPFPWQWFDLTGSTGVMRIFSGIEMVLWYPLLPVVVLGMSTLLKQHRIEGLLLLIFILVLVAVMSLVIANVGTMFRLRLQFLLVLLLIAAAGHPLVYYGKLLQACRSQARHILKAVRR